MGQDTFILRGLVSRGGLSNWVFFFTPGHLVMVDLGAWASVKAGISAGLRSQLAVDVAAEVRDGLRGAPADLQATCDDLGRKWKRVVEVDDHQIRRVTLHLRLLAHELTILSADGQVQKFGLRLRPAAGSARVVLASLLGPKFHVEETTLYALLSRHLPLLTQ